MASSKFLTIFLLLALIAVVVNAQNSTEETNEIDQCIKRENCAPNDRECRAACAGVPDPDAQVANETNACYKKCYDDYLPKNEDGYKSCTKDCREKVYQEGVTEPGSKAPSKQNQKDGDDKSGSGDGSNDDSTSSGNDNDSADENDTDSANGTDKDSGARFSAKSVHVYVFAAVIACVAFAVGL